jgi:hypothetical protein
MHTLRGQLDWREQYLVRMAGQVHGQLARLCVPNLDGAVFRRRHQQAAVAGPCHLIHCAHVTEATAEKFAWAGGRVRAVRLGGVGAAKCIENTNKTMM